MSFIIPRWDTEANLQKEQTEALQSIYCRSYPISTYPSQTDVELPGFEHTF